MDTCSELGQGKGAEAMKKDKPEKHPEEDYVEGCFRENYMKPHICPIATGGWCKDYIKCKALEGVV